MRKLVILLLTLTPLLGFSQRQVQNEIAWLPLEKAKELAKKKQ